MCASVHPGAGDMGSKLSVPGSEPTAQGLRTEGIHAAYRRGNISRAQHLLREACDESTSQLEKVRSMPALLARTGNPGWVKVTMKIVFLLSL